MLSIPQFEFSEIILEIVKQIENVRVFRNVRTSGSYLEFFQITPNNAGRYYCSATNPNGNVTKTAEVIVHHNEIPSDRAPHGRVQEVVEGETVSLECTEPTTPGARVSLSTKNKPFSFKMLLFIFCLQMKVKLNNSLERFFVSISKIYQISSEIVWKFSVEIWFNSKNGKMVIYRFFPIFEHFSQLKIEDRA